MDVGQYQFKTEGMKSISTINVTNNHRFYVENERGFIPIKKVQSTDYLLTDTGRQVKLLCSNRGQDGCGKPYHPENPVQVYNIEIDQRHTYFVGHDSILAHNPCHYPHTRFMKKYYDTEGKILKYEGYINIFSLEYHGEGTEYTEDGVKIYEGSWKKGQRHDIGTAFKSGKKEYYGFHVDGVREGAGALFDSTGKEKFRGIFKNGEPSGYGIEFTARGYVVHEGDLHASILVDLDTPLSKDGNLENKIFWGQQDYKELEKPSPFKENITEEQEKPDQWPDLVWCPEADPPG